MKQVPSSIYRLQLTKSFTIADATKLLPYLKSLGVEGVYCSPYFAAHSPHGYDVIDPNRLNPKLATEKEYARFCAALEKHDLFHLADVVPNHMGAYKENLWWQDVLEKGKESKYAKFFDIDWSQGKILVPFLGEDRIIEEEHYCLVPWWTSATKTSYRRFFTINELIGIRIEDPEVLREHHKLIFEFLKQGKVDGIRVDHPDGLLDPATYFQRLRKKHKGLIIVEKILGFGEQLPASWDVDGTVGYEFAHMLTGVFVNKSDALTKVYESFIGGKQDFEEMLYHNKKSFLQREMQGDLNNLASLLSTPFGNEALQSALLELLSVFPVYRSYIEPEGAPAPCEVELIKGAISKAKKRAPLLQNTFDYLEEIFSTGEHRDFILRFQQLSAPAMAKGFEDISLYQYNRLLALNDVGFEPARHGITKEEFHSFCKQKQETYPYGVLSTSTHDSKRSMDVRMILATLSEIPMVWGEALKVFSRLNAPHKAKGYPSRNHEYFLYQIILGVWPSKPSFRRLWQSFQKSIRESREHTNWQHPDEEYERACETFLKAILKKGSPFTKALDTFYKKIAPHGRYNTLASVALKLGCPGIVDIYEGCEYFRYTLVDPDNRTPVKLDKKPDIKVELHRKALNFRKDHKALFLEGEYIPLEVTGEGADQVVAFTRKKGKKRLVVAATRFTMGAMHLKGVQIHLENEMKRGVDLFSEEVFSGATLDAEALFAQAPFAWVFQD